MAVVNVIQKYNLEKFEEYKQLKQELKDLKSGNKVASKVESNSPQHDISTQSKREYDEFVGQGEVQNNIQMWNRVLKLERWQEQFDGKMNRFERKLQ